METAEKNVLPTADDVKAEKTHNSLIDGVENFSAEKLKSVKTREPASGKDGEQGLLILYVRQRIALIGPKKTAVLFSRKLTLYTINLAPIQAGNSDF